MHLLRVDVYTILLLLAAGHLVAIVFLAYYARYVRPDSASLAFIAGKILQVAAWLLVGLRQMIPDFLSLQLGNSLLSMGVTVECAAMALIRVELTRPLILAYAVPSLFAVVNVWMPFWDQSVVMGIGAFLFSSAYLVTGCLLLSGRSQALGLQKLIGVLSVLVFAGQAFRGIDFLFFSGYSLFEPKAVQVLGLYLFFFAMIAGSIGFILMKQELVDRGREQVIRDLRNALQQVRTLKGLIPICASCKKIRNDGGYWEQIEVYIAEHSDADFSHGLCPDCMRRLYPGLSGQEKNRP